MLHSYFPFGEELFPDGDTERMKFTGHERDLNRAGQGDDLDYMHARYCSPMLGRFLSVDPLGGVEPKPQSWNRYAYALNNPLAFTDPTGMYVTNCGSDEQCLANAKTFEQARQANLRSSDTEVQATAAAYGEPGVANGVTVTFGAVELGAAANVVPDIVWTESTGFNLVATVTIDPSLSRGQLRAIVGHEGQHVLDAQGFARTFTASGNHDASKNLTLRQTETNAYRITQRILVLENANARFAGRQGLVELGKGLPQTKVERSIESILEGPLYTDKLDTRQFPAYAP